MALMKKTADGTVFANTFDIPQRNEVGIFAGVYNVADVLSLGTLDGERVLLLNDDGIERAGVRIIHTDEKWNQKED